MRFGILACIATAFWSTSAIGQVHGPEITPADLPERLQVMITDLRQAAKEEDLFPFIFATSRDFVAAYDAGGMTTPNRNGPANFISLFGLHYPMGDPQEPHYGWQKIRAQLASTSFQNDDGHFCTPYYPPEIREIARPRMCFNKGDDLENGYYGWQISYYAMHGH